MAFGIMEFIIEYEYILNIKPSSNMNSKILFSFFRWWRVLIPSAAKT